MKSVEEVRDFLTESGISEAIADTFHGKFYVYMYYSMFHVNLIDVTENEIDGESFLELTEEDIAKLVKPLGIVKKMLKILRSQKFPVCLVDFFYC